MLYFIQNLGDNCSHLLPASGVVVDAKKGCDIVGDGIPAEYYEGARLVRDPPGHMGFSANVLG